MWSGIEFNSIACERAEGVVWVHAMIRVPLHDAQIRAELTLETADERALSMERSELRVWLATRLREGFGPAT